MTSGMAQVRIKTASGFAFHRRLFPAKLAATWFMLIRFDGQSLASHACAAKRRAFPCGAGLPLTPHCCLSHTYSPPGAATPLSHLDSTHSNSAFAPVRTCIIESIHSLRINNKNLSETYLQSFASAHITTYLLPHIYFIVTPCFNWHLLHIIQNIF